jgi:hypothetical protein
MTILSRLFAAGLVIAVAPAVAQGAESGREDAAWLQAYEMQGNMLTGPQRTALNQLAYHAAAANICEDLVLDRAKFSSGLAALEHADIVSLSDAELEYYQRHLMVNFGVAVGIMLAEHADNAAAFCEDAHAHMNDPDAVHYFDNDPDE